MRNAILLCALVTAVPALAQTAPSAAPAAQGTAAAPAASAAAKVTAGATIFDASGAQVGTVDQVAGDVVTVNTGTNKVGVPLGNFAAGPNGLVLGNTKAQLDAAAAQAAAQSQAQLRTALVPGAAVRGTGGIELGKVKAADDQFVTITSAKGDVRLPIAGVAAGPNGLVAGMTAAEFQAAVTAAKAQ
jgi:hypothetical protein